MFITSLFSSLGWLWSAPSSTTPQPCEHRSRLAGNRYCCISRTCSETRACFFVSLYCTLSVSQVQSTQLRPKDDRCVSVCGFVAICDKHQYKHHLWQTSVKAPAYLYTVRCLGLRPRQIPRVSPDGNIVVDLMQHLGHMFFFVFFYVARSPHLIISLMAHKTKTILQRRRLRASSAFMPSIYDHLTGIFHIEFGRQWIGCIDTVAWSVITECKKRKGVAEYLTHVLFLWVYLDQSDVLAGVLCGILRLVSFASQTFCMVFSGFVLIRGWALSSWFDDKRCAVGIIMLLLKVTNGICNFCLHSDAFKMPDELFPTTLTVVRTSFNVALSSWECHTLFTPFKRLVCYQLHAFHFLAISVWTSALPNHIRISCSSVKSSGSSTGRDCNSVQMTSFPLIIACMLLPYSLNCRHCLWAPRTIIIYPHHPNIYMKELLRSTTFSQKRKQIIRCFFQKCAQPEAYEGIYKSSRHVFMCILFTHE